MNPFQSLRDYELYVYTLSQRHPSILRSTLIVAQPHPNDPGLQRTHPHHKHVPPDIKHNRIPAPDVSFDRPNLQPLIEEIEVLIG